MDKVKVLIKLVRPYIAVAIVSATLGMFVAGQTVPPELLQLNGIVIGFYFAERAVRNGTTPQVPSG